MPRRKIVSFEQLKGKGNDRLMLHVSCMPARLFDLHMTTHCESSVFWAVAWKPGITASTISYMTGYSPRAISAALKKNLKGRPEEGWRGGIYELVEDQEDRRLKRIYLTEKGQQLHQKAAKDVLDFRDQLLIEQGDIL